MDNLFLTESVNKYQGIIHGMMAMLKIRCSMSLLHDEKEAKLIDFKIRETDGTIRDANSLEEFVRVINDFKTQMETRIVC